MVVRYIFQRATNKTKKTKMRLEDEKKKERATVRLIDQTLILLNLVLKARQMLQETMKDNPSDGPHILKAKGKIKQLSGVTMKIVIRQTELSPSAMWTAMSI